MIGAFTRFDLRSLISTQPARVLLPLAFVVVFGATLPVPGLAIVAGAVIASVSASIPFQGDERGRLDTLYGIAPVDRRTVVVGRYWSVLLFALVSVGIGTVTTLIMRSVRHQDFGWPLIAVMLLIAFGCVSVAYAVQLPWFFAMGFTRGRPMIYIPVGIIAVAGFLAGQSGLLDGAPSAAAFSLPPALLTVCVLVGGGVVLAASLVIATRLYGRREL